MTVTVAPAVPVSPPKPVALLKKNRIKWAKP
eukprot:CAMPEP_0202388840 /NCGR_PEP_ID=MMETSP1127-20130417/79769_1 /ASSEMBLY_ACC=CAM_ASM_000462 /TAXON_ID=3047 /ORGANISM="Dunaliella tertiolecta, Strain CCMP1320" /LENGTH=30 /DNA_ID= /DNA_START= /DNA_END= /DNA_ORIENTATION=